jgi:hypothetical protein
MPMVLISEPVGPASCVTRNGNVAGMQDGDRRWHHQRGGGGNAVYVLGLIGALVFYIRAADGFWQGVLGVLKALVWPAFVIYDLLKFLTPV